MFLCFGRACKAAQRAPCWPAQGREALIGFSAVIRGFAAKLLFRLTRTELPELHMRVWIPFARCAARFSQKREPNLLPAKTENPSTIRVIHPASPWADVTMCLQRAKNTNRQKGGSHALALCHFTCLDRWFVSCRGFCR